MITCCFAKNIACGTHLNCLADAVDSSAELADNQSKMKDSHERLLWRGIVVSCWTSVRLYICQVHGRLAFVLASGLFHHCGVKNCVVGLKKIKERSKE